MREDEVTVSPEASDAPITQSASQLDPEHPHRRERKPRLIVRLDVDVDHAPEMEPVARLRSLEPAEMRRLLQLAREDSRRAIAGQVLRIFRMVVLSTMGLLAIDRIVVSDAVALIAATGFGSAVPIILTHYFPNRAKAEKHEMGIRPED